MSDLDIMQEMQRSSTSKRYKTMSPVGTPPDGSRMVKRASRPSEPSQLVRKTIEYADDAYDDDEPITRVPRRTADYQQRRTADVDTNNDVQVAPSVRRLRDEQAPLTKKLPPEERQGRSRAHWLVLIGTGMLIMLVVWIVAVWGIVGWTNTFSDPSHYTQTAHLDTVTVTTDMQGHQSQVRAFIDAQGHVDLLILPVSGDMSKAHVVVGPVSLPLPDPQRATITVSAKGTVVTILVQGPLEDNVFVTARQSSSWIYDLASSNKGGH